MFVPLSLRQVAWLVHSPVRSQSEARGAWRGAPLPLRGSPPPAVWDCKAQEGSLLVHRCTLPILHLVPDRALLSWHSSPGCCLRKQRLDIVGKQTTYLEIQWTHHLSSHQNISRGRHIVPLLILIYLSTAIVLTPSGSGTVHIYTQTIQRTTQITT